MAWLTDVLRVVGGDNGQYFAIELSRGDRDGEFAIRANVAFAQQLAICVGNGDM